MPIRFRCAHCDKLLGIARRKAGSIVNCPQCGQPLIVPTPEEDAPDDDVSPDASTHQSEMRTDLSHGSRGSPAGSPKLFEQDDIDRLLDLSPTHKAVPSSSAGTVPHPAATAPSRAIVPHAQATANGFPMPLPMPAPVPAGLPVPVPTAGGISIGKIILMILVVFVLVTAAFVGGVFVGKGMR